MTARLFSFLVLALSMTALLACEKKAMELELAFPNDAARLATDELEVFVFEGDGSSGRSDVRCAEVLGRLAKDKSLGVEPYAGTLTTPFIGKEVQDFPAGNPVVFVVGYRRIDAEQRYEFLEGCTEEFDTDGSANTIRVDLQMIEPTDIFLEKSSGDLQVSLVGDVVSIGLQVRARAKYANAPRPDALYPLPGLSMRVKVEQGLEIIDAETPNQIEIATNGDGLAEILVRADRAGDFQVSFEAITLDSQTVTFSLSALETLSYEASQFSQWSLGALGRAVGVSVGNFAGDDKPDLVALMCEGDEKACLPGSLAGDEPGNSNLSLFIDIEKGQSNAPEILAGAEFGIAANGLVVTDLLPGEDYDDIAYLNSRRKVGGAVSEGSEILILQGKRAGPTLSSRYTLNSSNAIGLVTYQHRTNDAFPSLATAAQGRRNNTVACDDGPKCSVSSALSLPPCPAGEYCFCDDDLGCNCRADDRFVDKLVNRTRADSVNADFYNFDKCHSQVLTCNKKDPLAVNPPGSECFCADEGNSVCPAVTLDYCNCKVPRRDLIGSVSSPAFPKHLSGGVLQTGFGPGLVIAADSGLRFLEPIMSGVWKDKGFPILSDFPEFSVIQDIDRDQTNDVIWFAQKGCQLGRCIVQSASEEARNTAQGCFGVLLRSDANSELYALKDDTCRTYLVEFAPESFCLGRLNRDAGLDLVLASSKNSKVLIYLGNGQGGFLSKPVSIEIPDAKAGGAITCADLDGDSLDEIILVDGIGEAITVVWAQ